MMTSEDLIDMARVIIQAVNAGADEYDIARQLLKINSAGVSEGIKSMSEALAK